MMINHVFISFPAARSVGELFTMKLQLIKQEAALCNVNTPALFFLRRLSWMIPKTQARSNKAAIIMTAVMNCGELTAKRFVDCCSAGLSSGS